MKTPEERITEDCISIPVDYTFYTELGKDFRRFRDKTTGDMFEIKVRKINKKSKTIPRKA